MSRSRRGFTVVELLVSVGLIGLLCALTMPAVQSSREKARGMQCRHQLRQLALALQNHEATHQAFPRGGVMVNDGTSGQTPRCHAPHIYLLPFLDQADAFHQIDRRIATDRYLAIIAGVNDANEAIKRRRFPIFVCPSEVQSGQNVLNSYRANIGVTTAPYRVWRERLSNAGSFFPTSHACTAADFGDGLSQTVAFSERIADDGNSRVYSPAADWWQAGYRSGVPSNLSQKTQAEISTWFISECASLRELSPPHASDLGSRWFDAGLMDTWYNHALTPNHHVPDCGITGGAMAADIVTARSHHTHGVNVVFMDGSARLVSVGIDERVWQAWGTRNGNEVVTGE